jgi:hypothetical protein
MNQRSLRVDIRHRPASCGQWARSLAPGWLLAVALLFPGDAHAQNPTFSISLQNDKFVPSELDVPAGQKIELHVKNERASASEFESFELRREKIVPAGEQVIVYVGPLRPGTYNFFDDFNPTTRGHLIAR